MKYCSEKLIALTMGLGIAAFPGMTGAPANAQVLASNSSVSSQIRVEPDCDIRFFGPPDQQAAKKILPDSGHLKSVPFVPLFLEELKINWVCISSDDSRVGFHGIAILNPYTKKWTLDWSRIFGSAGTKREDRWLYQWFSKKYKIIQLSSSNANGYAIFDSTQTEAGSIPDELDKEGQNSGPVLLSFCIVRPPKALCGNGHLGQKQDDPAGDLISYALKVIRGIEFVE
ncbi:hypothetical protein [Variovorax boronicumulans]|uniref:hypothetical protein n=1 Tax=Variovorax boronicumulans TaxID=436515 RepID=UPI003393C1EF